MTVSAPPRYYYKEGEYSGASQCRECGRITIFADPPSVCPKCGCISVMAVVVRLERQKQAWWRLDSFKWVYVKDLGHQGRG